MWRYALPLVLLPGLATAQEDDRDPGFLAGLIEDSVSAPGLTVQIDGFEGAFSSEASIAVLRIADDEGTWLVAQDLVLDWDRAALLRGRLDVTALTAEFIRFERPPLPPEGITPPPAAASGFSLPDLPVAIDIGNLTATRIELGEALLGQEAALSLTASAQLSGGSGAARVEAQRLDGPLGQFSIDASYDAGEQPVVTLSLDAREAQGGLAATLLAVPDAPALDLSVEGGGPLDDFAVDLRLASDGQERFGGRVALNGVDAGRRFDVNLSGDMRPLLTPEFHPFFGDDISLTAQGLQAEDGSLSLDRLNLQTEVLTMGGQLQLDPQGWPRLLDLDGRLASDEAEPVRLPSANPITLSEGRFLLKHDADAGEDWRLDLDLTDLTHPTIDLGRGQISVSGVLERDGSSVTRATASLLGSLRQMIFADPALAQAAGSLASVNGTLTWQRDQPTSLSDLRLNAAGLVLTGQAALLASEDESAGLPVSLDLVMDVDQIARFSGLAGQNLSGAATLRTTGAIDPLAGTFDLRLDGQTDALGIGIGQVDPLLAGQTDLDVTARRSLQGTFVDGLTLQNDQLSLALDAAIYGEDSEASQDGLTGTAILSAQIVDGAPIDPRLAGPITLDLTATQGADRTWSGLLDADAPNGVTLNAAGRLTGETPDIALNLLVPDTAAFVAGVPGEARLSGRAFAENGIWSIDASTALPWDLTATLSGPVTGRTPRLAFEAALPDLTGPVPALADIPPLATGVRLRGALAQRNTGWVLDARAETDSGIEARAQGPVTGAPELTLTASLPDLSAMAPALAGYDALKGELSAEGTLTQGEEGWSTDLRIVAPSAITARILGDLTGEAAPDLAVAATIPRVEQFVPQVSGTLSVDATLQSSVDGLMIAARAGGPLDAQATVDAVLGETLAADYTLRVPSLAPLAPVSGGLDITGTARQVEGGFDITAGGTGPYDAQFNATVGTADALAITAQGQIPDASRLAPELRGPINFAATAAQTGEAWTVEANVDGAQAISAQVAGIATGPEADLEISASVANISAFVPGLSGPLNANGRLQAQTGGYGFSANASGPLNATLSTNGQILDGIPSAQFDLSVPDIGPLVPDLSGPLRATGRAAQQGEQFAVDMDMTGPGGTTATVSGTAGTSLDLAINGAAPLGLANAFIAPNRLSGTARFDLRADGAPGLDALSGTITTTGSALSLPELRNGFEQINATITLANTRAQVQLGAELASGGNLSVTGPIGLTAPFNGDLALRFDGRVEDPSLYTVRVLSDLRLAGALTGGASVSGDVLLDEAEISVPSSGLTAVGALPPIRHVGPAPAVQRTLSRAGQTGEASTGRVQGGQRSGPAYPLDITVRAPNRIFIRGRGLDAELGGELAVRGTSANPVISGGFELVRGRLDILQQRFQLDEGSVTFQGTLDPYIRLVADTETDALNAAIVVEGPASSPEVSFESSPSVPQEEILAQIFFGRDLQSLSPLQALQLANSIATLAGRGNGGLLERLRGNAGLDDLDLTTDDEGNTALRAGKYISDNVYTDVQIDQTGEPRVSLNIDLTPNLTVRGATGASGDTSVGVFFEKDY